MDIHAIIVALGFLLALDAWRVAETVACRIDQHRIVEAQDRRAAFPSRVNDAIHFEIEETVIGFVGLNADLAVPVDNDLVAPEHNRLDQGLRAVGGNKRTERRIENIGNPARPPSKVHFLDLVVEMAGYCFRVGSLSLNSFALPPSGFPVRNRADAADRYRES